MNSNRLLALYENLAEAPDAIVRLRRFVIDLAVRGKLVAQEIGDEPAPDLLKRIAVERERLIAAKIIQKAKMLSLLDVIDIPFSLPCGWVWTQVSEIGIINPRNNVPDDYEASFIPMSMIPSEYGEECKRELRTWNQIKKGYTHFADGDVGIAKITPCFQNGKSTVFRNLANGIGAGTTELHVVRPIFVYGNYIILYLKSSNFINTGISKMTGTAGQKRVPTTYFACTHFPLPPLAEQHRIVAKVEELMELLNQLEAARTVREGIRDKLSSASYANLSSPDTSPAEFQTHACFTLATLHNLTRHPEQIRSLRQTIIDLAVRGKLVVQDSGDEPVSELLQKITRERATRVERGEIKQSKSLEPVEDAPFKAPLGWEWIPLGDTGNIFSGNSINAAVRQLLEKTTEGLPFIATKDVGYGLDLINYENGLLVPTPVDRFKVARAKSVLICAEGGSAGRKIGISEREICFGNKLLANETWTVIVPEFVRLVYMSDFFYAKFESRMTGVSGGNSIKNFFLLPFPLPPLAEQRRIVERVDSLMLLCDKLEFALENLIRNRSHLITALITEALSFRTDKEK